jgi:enoyl-CoA hydratase/carnithine racemase
MDTGRISLQKDGAICRVVIDQPAKMNALSFDMWSALPDAIRTAESDAAIRVITLEGAGEKAFCAGADISQFGDKRTGSDATRAYDRAVANGMAAVQNAQKPTVALIRGICFGGGLMLALACDIRLARADSRFRLPAARLGLGYAASNVALMVQRIGISAASDILFSARILDAAEAERVGIASTIWPIDSFEAQSARYVQTIGANAPLTLAAIKRSLIELSRPENDRNLAAVNALVERCFTSEDYREGQAAVRETRDPVFTGR